MVQLVSNCPRCDAENISFRVIPPLNHYETAPGTDWRIRCEAFAICSHCMRATTILVEASDYPSGEYLLGDLGLDNLFGTLNGYVDVTGYVSVADFASEEPPPHLPPNLDNIFREGARCVAINCYNAAGAMFRLCLDIVTKEKLAEFETAATLPAEIPKAVQHKLFLRLQFLFNNGILDRGLKDISDCVREDGNDGAHDGTLSEEDALDLQDFTKLLLDRIYSEPKRIENAAVRRTRRRGGETTNKG